MKIGVITLYGLFNYGNRLQNLAITEILGQRGFDVETICCERITIGKVFHFIKNLLFPNSLISRRERAFVNFNNKYIKVRKYYRQDLKLPKTVNEKYDVFIVGSDQVWNPELRKKERDTFFLRFTTKDKRVCLSPSIGISKIDDVYYEEFRDGLRGFNYLSCREEDGTKEIERISGMDCKTLLDPTLALDVSFWRTVGSYESLPKEKYILSFFLGEKDADISESINKYAKKKGCLIIDMFDRQNDFFCCGPEMFISLIDKAEIVFTDSFHAVAFSVNMNTPFYAFERQLKIMSSMSSRITSLVSMLGLNDRFIDSHLSEYDSKCDFSKSNKKLLLKRLEFNNYLDKVLSGV